MGKLGQIEAVAKDVNREADTFDMLGETFTVVRRPSLVDSLKSAAIGAEEDLTDAEKLTRQTDLAHTMLRKCLSPESFTRYIEACEENELGVDVIWQTVQLLVGAATGKAQQQRSDSSDGSSPTSMSGSSEQVGLIDYARKGLTLVTAEDWAKEYLPEAV